MFCENPVMLERPAGVSAIAVGFGLASAYLWAMGVVGLASPDREPVRQITLLVVGLLYVGPYIALLAGIAAALIGWGLWRLNNWARLVAMIFAAAGIVMLVPGVSSPMMRWTFAASGAGMIVRVMVLWYLWRDDVAAAFGRVN